MVYVLPYTHAMTHRMEQNSKFPGHVYMDYTEDAFFFLAKHYLGMTTIDDGESEWYGEQRKFLDKSVTRMSFTLLKVPAEEMEEGLAQHWTEEGKYSVAAEEVS